MSNHSFESQKREKKLLKMPINSLAEGESGGETHVRSVFRRDMDITRRHLAALATNPRTFIIPDVDP